MELTSKVLKSAAKEFNKVVQLADEDGNPTPVNVKSDNLEKELYDALEFIEDGDEFSVETDKVFNELKIKFTPKPVVKSKKGDKKKKEVERQSVEVGATVEMDPDNDKIKKEKKMKSENGSEMENAVRLVLSRTAKKDELMGLLEGDLFDKKAKKALSKVTNFLSLKKQMKEALDPDVVAEVEAELKAEPKPKSESKPKVKKEKDSPLVKEIKDATKVKQLKKIAKANDQFNWKVLKALDFDEMQKAMLSGAKPEMKVKMIPNPLIAEIEGFKKAKKLVKWAKENEEVGYTKAMKKMDLADLQEALIASIPAEIEKGSGKSGGEKRKVTNHIDQEARKNRIIEMVDEGKYTRKEILAVLKEEFPEEGKAHTNSNILSECKSTVPYKDGQRWERFGIDRLVVEDKNGCYTWPEAVEKTKKEKKDKKNKKSKK